MTTDIENGVENGLYDDSLGYEDDTGIKVRPGLSEKDRKKAVVLYRLFNNLCGLVAVKGDVGAGKDTFLNWLLHTIRRYYPDKKILRDEKPRSLFGPYDGLFNEELLVSDLSKMRDVAKQHRSRDLMSAAMDKLADDWVSEKGQVMLHNSVLGLTEFWKYCYNREPFKPMNKTMGAIHKVKRHLNTLIVGCTQLETDLDKRTCKPFVDWKVTCLRSMKDTSQYTFLVRQVSYDPKMDILAPVNPKVFRIPVDAGKPRSYIGDGRIVIRNHDYQPTTPEEAIVLEAIKAGLDNYEELVAFLESAGDMSEFETLATLKTLCLHLPHKRSRFAIWYPCYYHIFNSRSAPSIKTSVTVGD